MLAVEQARDFYASMPDKIARARRTFARPLTLAEEILVAHAADFDGKGVNPLTGAAGQPMAKARRVCDRTREARL